MTGRASLAWVAVGVLVIVAGWLPLLVKAAPEPLIRPGQMYVFVWSCLPQLQCYGEVVKVETVREDGWVEAISCGTMESEQIKCGTDRWRSNLSQLVSVQPWKPPAGRSANE